MSKNISEKFSTSVKKIKDSETSKKIIEKSGKVNILLKKSSLFIGNLYIYLYT
jgi:hypothetical protein